jgi:AraC-like DNA-binding protein
MNSSKNPTFIVKMSKEPKIYLYKRIVQAKLFIGAHYKENIDLNNIADEAYFSKYHFIRLFKNIYGYTPYQYLTRVRIENAQELLRTGKNVTEVCFEVGFDSPSSFTGLFKRIVKQTPSAFQKAHFKRQEQIQAQPLQFIPFSSFLIVLRKIRDG